VNGSFLILPNRPSAFVSLPADAPHFLRVSGTLTVGENPVVEPELISKGQIIEETGIVGLYYTETGEYVQESFSGCILIITRILDTGVVSCSLYKFENEQIQAEWRSPLSNNTWDISTADWTNSAQEPATGIPVVQSIPFTLALGGLGDQALVGNQRYQFASPNRWNLLGTFPAAAPLAIS
jgi:hypothetical protein